MTGTRTRTIERGPGKSKTEKKTYTVTGGMCPRCEGMGSVTDFDLSALYDTQQGLRFTGSATIEIAIPTT